MKLISCHINNFGNIENMDLQFDEGLNVICRENGWGKSTLSAFLRVMLYGFENDGTASRKSERKKYRPWQGGLYGGSLTIEYQGKEYIIYKNFKDRASEDEIEVRYKADNTVTDILGKCIGETLFLLNRESFERTICIRQGNCEVSVNGTINGRLGNVEELKEDIGRYEEADKKLDAFINSLTPNRKTGRLKAIKTEITEVQRSIREKDTVEKSYDRISDLLRTNKEAEKTLTKGLDNISRKISEESKRKNSLAKKEVYDELLKEANEREQKLNDIKMRFKGDIPDKVILSEKADLLSQIKSFETMIKEQKLSEEEEEEFERLGRIYESKPVSKEKIDNTRENIRSLFAILEDAERKKMPQESILRLNELSKQFINGVPESIEINSTEKAIADKLDAQTTIRNLESERSISSTLLEDRISKNESDRKKKKQLFITLGVVILLCGIWMYFINPYLAGVALIGLVFFFIPVKSEEVKGKERLDEIEIRLKEENDRIESAENIINTFIDKYCERYTETNPSLAIFELRKDLQEYLRLKNFDNSIEIEELTKKATTLEEDIYEYLATYLPGLRKDYKEYMSAVSDIDIKYDRYRYVKSKKEKYGRDQESLEILVNRLTQFLEDSGYTKDTDPDKVLNELSDNLSELGSAEIEYDNAVSRKKTFEKEHPDFDKLLQACDGGDEDLERLDEKRINFTEELRKIKESIASYQLQLEELKEKLSALYEAEEKYELLNAEKEQLEKEYSIYTKTKDYLHKASLQFTGKFTGPVENGLKKYMGLINQEEAGTYHIDTAMNLTKEVKGLQRSLDTLSQGQQDMSGVCMRLALVDAMFKQEKPFIIMDDPFVNIDTRKKQSMIDVIQKLSSEYQIIYFTCHEDN